MKKANRLTMVFMAAMLSGMAILPITNAVAETKPPLKFGVALPMSGPEALFGADQVTAQQWAVDDINASGGVDGHPLEMIALDTQANPQLGINAVNRLINVDKVPALVTSWSSVVKAVAPIANREKVIEFSVGANSPDIAELGDYVYTVFPLADVDVTALAKYTHDVLKKEKAAILYINNDSGIPGARIYRKIFEEAGGKVVSYEAYDPKTTDFTSLVLQVKAANPDIIHIHGLVGDLPQLVAQIRQLGLTQRISTYSIGFNPKVIEQLGDAAEGLIVTSLSPGVNDNENMPAYIERWMKNYNRVPNGMPYTQYNYDTPYIIAELYRWVLKNNLPITGENMRKALLDIKSFELPLTGYVTFSDDHRVLKPVYLLTVENGKFEPLATIN
ncbi:ABC transporter substrate-binding protein [Castellaniella sp.]|uniref:ABC transporter substrate-binding protein n=1 Tax=Castellaniella sp. TaxID=1955812 RepID=UPI0035637BF7